MLKVFQGVTWTTIKWSMTTISNQLFTTGYTYTSFKGQYFPVNIHASNYMKVHLQNGIFLQTFYATIETVTSTMDCDENASRLLYRAQKSISSIHTHIGDTPT